MPARSGEPTEQRISAILFVEVKALRIVFRRERLIVGGEMNAPTSRRGRHRCLRRTTSVRSPGRSMMIGEIISHSAWPAALRMAHLKVTMPVSGRSEVRASVTSTSSVRSSPGLNGASQRSSLTPGEPSEAARPMKPSDIIRIISEQRCQPGRTGPSAWSWGGHLVEMHRLRIDRRQKPGSRRARHGADRRFRSGRTGKSSKVRVICRGWWRKGQIVAALCGNLNPSVGMARLPTAVRCRTCLIRWGRCGVTTRLAGGETMFSFSDLFRWDRFITPTMIKTFYG